MTILSTRLVLLPAAFKVAGQIQTMGPIMFSTSSPTTTCPLPTTLTLQPSGWSKEKPWGLLWVTKLLADARDTRNTRRKIASVIFLLMTAPSLLTTSSALLKTFSPHYFLAQHFVQISLSFSHRPVKVLFHRPVKEWTDSFFQLRQPVNPERIYVHIS